MVSMKDWWIERFQERSTWGALLVVAGSLWGSRLAPDTAEAIMTIGLILAGGIGVGTRERK